MIQAVGLTSNPRKAQPPAVNDVSFEAQAGHLTVLLGAAGAGKTTVLGLMLELRPGRGITYFRGRPLHRIAHPSREVGVVLGDVPGHPARTVRGHLRMLCAATGVPARRADEVLEAVGLVSLREERLGTLSRGMDRRLGLACALLPDPHTLVLDEPAADLSPAEVRWMHTTLRAYADQGGTVLLTTADPKEAARTADHVVTLDGGRVVADQEGREFARTRLRPRVAVRSPQAERLATLLAKEARVERRSVEVVAEGGNRLSVYGSTTADIGETAYRHRIMVHQLADQVGDMGPGGDLAVAADGEGRSTAEAPDAESSATDDSSPAAGADLPDRVSSPLPPPIPVRSALGPLRPLRYELRRAAGIRTGFLTSGVVLLVSALVAVLLARIGHTPQERLFAAWPRGFPLPPVALAAGLLGALSFGDEFRYPALAVDRVTVPRRLGLLGAKLLVSGTTAAILAFLTLGCDAEALYLLYGRELTQVPEGWPAMGVSWFALVIGCAWAGVLAAGVFRSTTAGLAAVLAVPVAVVPLMRQVFEGSSVRTAAGITVRMHDLLLLQWPLGGDRYVLAVIRVVAQPVGGAMVLSLGALLCAYLFTTPRIRVR
ncbi:ATP-binding cassette domain-containing protein [Streptomyces sp. NPDC059597]|uniref:ABC transporter ATP-binding protein n=1 Tax=Streptomyces sp. NPDC059597 TaxID=3346879 RepID=UPI0036D1F85F